MISILTGDIVHSRTVSDPRIWLDPLKQLLTARGPTPEVWEMYRGDSFQAEVPVIDALQTALQMKAMIRQIKDLDVRIAIGIGEKSYSAPSISESSGEVFLRSGELLEQINEKGIHLAFASGSEAFDKEMNLMLRLALVIIHGWSRNTAQVAELLLANPGLSQTKIGRQLGISQPSVSERASRGHLYDILALEQYYRERVQSLMNSH